MEARRAEAGYTILEIFIALGVVAILAAIAIPQYIGYRERAAGGGARSQLADIAAALKVAATWDNRLPRNLAEIFGTTPLDQWGNPIQYLPFDGSVQGWKGKRRKDKNLVPINSEFDLYSMGPDGKSSAPLTAQDSRDDIVWANDGGYIGPASEY